jgi:hypothetical protein
MPAGENSSTVLLNAFATKTSPAASVATLAGTLIPLDSVCMSAPALENSSTVLFPWFATKTSPAASVATLLGNLIPLDSVADGVVDAVTSVTVRSNAVVTVAPFAPRAGVNVSSRSSACNAAAVVAESE